jgi:hypothetical protein
VSTSPALSTAAQHETDGHDTAKTLFARWLSLQARRPPAGRVDVIRFPALSAATHNDTDGHEITCKLL